MRQVEDEPGSRLRAVPPRVADAPVNGASDAGGADTETLGRVQRTVEILRILYRNDFFGMMRQLARAERRPKGLNGRAEVKVPADMPRKVRRILEELGPSFVKIGQLLGTRPDLVPKPFVDEFKNLYDATTPTPFTEIKPLLERELGRSLEEVFREIEEAPVASASIGQVHFATLLTGEKVAVKVQHPGIEERVTTDFEIMEPMVRFVENLFAASRVWQPRQHFNEVFQMLVKELDYRFEAGNHQRVYDNFRGDATVKIPKIHWAYSTKRVLTLERIEGVKLSDFENPDLKALEGERVAEIITHAMARMIFEDRLFHADPSPGNLMAIDSHTVAFLDFGAVGRVTKRRSEKILELIMGFVRADIEAVRDALLAICNLTGEPPDPHVLDRDLERIMDYHERERASPADPVVLEMTIDVATRHQMLLPPDFMLITRALFQFEGLCKKLDPKYELVEVLEPYVRSWARREVLGADTQRDAFVDLVYQTMQLARVLPGRVNTITRKLEQNDLRFRVDVADVARYQEKEERRTLRGTFTTMMAALVIGVGLVMALGQVALLIPFLFASALVVLLWAFVMLYWSD